MCGAKRMTKDAAACTKPASTGLCLRARGRDEVYTLKTSSDEDQIELGTLAGKMAKVSGEISAENMMVKSVAMGHCQ